MEKSPQNGARDANEPPRRAPYRPPTLRAHGSIQAITQAKFVNAPHFDGAGGGGKTSV